MMVSFAACVFFCIVFWIYFIFELSFNFFADRAADCSMEAWGNWTRGSYATRSASVWICDLFVWMHQTVALVSPTSLVSADVSKTVQADDATSADATTPVPADNLFFADNDGAVVAALILFLTYVQSVCLVQSHICTHLSKCTKAIFKRFCCSFWIVRVDKSHLLLQIFVYPQMSPRQYLLRALHAHQLYPHQFLL